MKRDLFLPVYLEWRRWFLFSCSFEKEMKIFYAGSLCQWKSGAFLPFHSLHGDRGILFLHANKGRKRETILDAFEISCTLHVEELSPI